MASFSIGRKRLRFARYLTSAASVVVAISLAGPIFAAPADTGTPRADQLIALAAQAEIGGDVARSVTLRKDAVRANRDHHLARWQLGNVQVNTKWMTVEEAERRAARSRQQADYAQLRLAASEGPEDQYVLAKWCRENNLIDESRYHWANVLTADPNNQEAQRALDVRWFQGQLMHTADITAAKKAESVRQREHLTARINKWRTALADDSDTPLENICAEIRSIHLVETIPPIEAFIARPGFSKEGVPEPQQKKVQHDMSEAFVDALAAISDQRATEAVLRQAVWSPFSDVQKRAIAVLKKRPRYDYVPTLLDALQGSVESSYHIETMDDGTVRYTHTLYQPGATADHEMTYVRNLRPNPILTRMAHAFDGIDAHLPGGSQILQVSAPGRRMELEMQAQANDQSARYHNMLADSNDRNIIRVLAKTTDQNLGDDPRPWWKWWQAENEYYVPPKQPVYQERRESTVYSMSCFVAGTPVWTKTGKQPIESLGVGDLVLSQNVDTGELRYEPVLVRTVRPPSAILHVSFEGDELATTKGHPFWVSGTGWRMAKEIQSGAVLCGLKQAAKVRAIEPSGEAEAYNLVVAEFGTYFVGKSGVLVHDNSPRKPTRAIVPGLLAAK